MKAAAFIATSLIVAAAVFLFPISRRRDLNLLIGIARNKAPLVITGNSAAVTASRCDSSASNILELLSAKLHRDHLNLAFPGQTLTESANLAGLAMRTAATTDVIALVSYFELQDWDNLDLQQYVFYRLANPSLHAEPLLGRLLSGRAVIGAPHLRTQPFEYEGQKYENYDLLSGTLFEAERNAMPCPENDGLNQDFVTAYYYQQYQHYPPNLQNVELLASLGRVAIAAGKRLWIVIMPIDYQLLDRLGPSAADLVQQRSLDVVRSLRGRGLTVVDLSESLGNAAFGDRWCACGHLQLTGREAVAAALADTITGAGAH